MENKLELKPLGNGLALSLEQCIYWSIMIMLYSDVSRDFGLNDLTSAFDTLTTSIKACLEKKRKK